jgi:hypothetical protein
MCKMISCDSLKNSLKQELLNIAIKQSMKIINLNIRVMYYFKDYLPEIILEAELSLEKWILKKSLNYIRVLISAL